MRTTPYKEDSTRGSSLINPLNYKGDVLVQVWMDSRVLATLTNWLEKSGAYPRFMSESVRRPLESLAAHLVDTGQVEMVDDTVTARALLENRFRVTLNKGERGGKNILHNQILSDKRVELAEQANFNDVQKLVSAKKRVPADILAAAVKKYNEIAEQEAKDAAERIIQERKDRGELVNE